MAILILLLLALCLGGCEPAASQPPPGEGAAPPPVSVAPVTRQRVQEFDEYSARLEAVELVEVRARVSGTLEQVHFRDGQLVRKGERLFTLDPRPFAAEVARADANLASARTAAGLARSVLARGEVLLPMRAVSQQEVDQLAAALHSANSAVAASQAALETARLNLGYTRIAAPIAGRVSRSAVTAGNLVNANDVVLTSIVSTGRIYAYLDASETSYLKYGRAVAAGAGAPPVRMGLSDETGFPHEGRMDFVDNRLNPATGSMHIRAVFDNANSQFTPGLSARVRLSGGAPYEATVVPDRAIATDQTRKVVLVVGAGNKVESRQVQTFALIDGMRVVSGVRPGERIVVDGLQRAFPGASVTPQLLKVDARGMPQDAGKG
ncbi:MAG: efflux RND transporter periplasmic adaptor subunit [Pseudomonadota bacterium]